MKRKALGRGLSAILSDLPKADTPHKNIQNIPIQSIDVNHLQPRSFFDDEKLNELSDSIRRQGILQPLLIRKHPDQPDRYQLIAGERRLRAGKMASLTEVPCIILDAKEDQMLEIALIENVQRSDLNPVEEARAYKHLTERFSLTQEEVASRVGKSRETIANSLRLLNLPSEALDSLSDGRISIGHAKALLSIKDRERLITLADRVSSEGLSVRETERLTRIEKNPSPSPKEKKEKDIYTAELERALEEAFQTKVQIRQQGKNKGVIEIQYYDLSHLDGILKKWKINLQ